MRKRIYIETSIPSFLAERKAMNDEEIRAVRKIRHEISAEFGHDIHKVVAYYRTVEEEMRRSGEFRFVDASEAPRRRAEATSTIALVTSANA